MKTLTKLSRRSRLARRFECLALGHKPVLIDSPWKRFVERARAAGQDVTTHVPMEHTVCDNCGVRLP